jgi:hypothetical protein
MSNGSPAHIYGLVVPLSPYSTGIVLRKVVSSSFLFLAPALPFWWPPHRAEASPTSPTSFVIVLCLDMSSGGMDWTEFVYLWHLRAGHGGAIPAPGLQHHCTVRGLSVQVWRLQSLGGCLSDLLEMNESDFPHYPLGMVCRSCG